MQKNMRKINNGKKPLIDKHNKYNGVNGAFTFAVCFQSESEAKRSFILKISCRRMLPACIACLTVDIIAHTFYFVNPHFKNFFGVIMSGDLNNTQHLNKT